MRPRFLGPWRRGLQWAANLVYLLLPFVRVGGRPAFQIDLGALTLHLFGTDLGLGELYLLWLAALVAIFAFLLFTFILGRVWCGWCCPQTALVDGSEGVARLLGLMVRQGRILGAFPARLLLHGIFLAVGLLYGAALVWYFVPPYDYFPALISGSLGGWAQGTTLVAAAVVYLDLAMIRRLLCREFCPYGRFQAALVDAGTLTLQMPPTEAWRCIDCRACVRACPVDIDIRRGPQGECISCSRCLDACRTVMVRQGEPGVIGYAFGVEGRGPRELLNPRLVVVLVLFLVVCGALVVAAGSRATVTLKVERNAVATPRLVEGGAIAVFYAAYLENRGATPITLDLAAVRADGVTLPLRGQTRRLALQPGGHRKVAFAVENPPGSGPTQVEFTAGADGGEPLATATAYLPASMQGVRK